MNIGDFKKSLSDLHPPSSLNPTLQALWHDHNGNWDRAHELAQEASNTEGAWVHAYLHRKEGDESNASYWYTRAGRPKPNTALETEWETLVKELCLT